MPSLSHGLLLDSNFYLKCCHAVILLTFCLGIQLSLGDQPEPPLPPRMVSLRYTDPPQLFSHDEDGNIVLNGKMNGSTVFEVNFAPVVSYGNKVQIEFCRAPGPQACDQNQGLAICWERHKANNSFENSNPTDPRMRQLIDTCNGMQGVMLTTEIEEESEVFRLDTVYGNTYRFKVPEKGKKCFKLNLFGFQHFPGTKQMLEDEKKRRLEVLRKKRAARFAWYSDLRAKSGISMSSDEIELEKPVDPQNQMEDLDGNKIVMQDEELQMWAYTRPLYHLVKFKVQGGGHCCGLSAKIVGRSISKCYFVWRQLVACLASNNASGVNTCPYNFKIGVSPKLDYGEQFPLNQRDRNTAEQMFGVYLTANFTDFYPLLKQNIVANLSQMIVMNEEVEPENFVGTLDVMEQQQNGNANKETRHITGESGARAETGPDYANPNGPEIPYTTVERQLVFRCFGLEIDTDGIDERFNHAIVMKDVDDWLERNGYPVPGKPEPKC